MKRMAAYASFDECLAAQSPGNQAIIRALRRFVSRTAPGLTEAVKWGNGCWVGKNGPVAYVHSHRDYVQFGFFRGSALTDPRRLLQGKGKYVRFVRLSAVSAIDEASLAALLRQAARA